MPRERKPVILLAEDDAADRKITLRAFRQTGIDCEVFEVADGEETLDFLFRRGAWSDPAISPRPDLLLLDLNMPRVDGRQVLERIRGEPSLAPMRVVVLTTSDEAGDVERTYALGVHSFITKPVSLDRYVEVIHRLSEYWFDIVHLPPRPDIQ